MRMWSQDDHRQGRIKPSQLPEGRTEPGSIQLGRSIVVKGEIAGSEDLTIDGQVEGSIVLPAHTLTVGPNATICADITAKVVTIFGTVLGSITAHDRVDVRRSGSVDGNVNCGRLTVQDGAIVNGTIETRGDARQRQAHAAPAENAA